MRTITIMTMLAAAIACGGSEGDGRLAVDAGATNGPDADTVAFAMVSGTVWVPGNAPGMVPSGQEIPVFNAVVYLSTVRPDEIDEGATCRPCTEAPPNAVQTDHSGNFTIGNVLPRNYWLVIEKGDFRLEQEITVAPHDSVVLTAQQTTLPSVNDPSGGKTIPNIALATGIFDDMEDILGKMGLGSVDAEGAFQGPSAAGVFEFYDNGGPNAAEAVGTLTELMNDLDRMLEYDIIFIPCSGSDHVAALQSQQVLKNIRDYVAAGGKLYVTDWSGEWADNVFPEQVQLSASADTPANAYNAANDSWDSSQFGDANGSPSYTSEHAEAVNEDLRLWLDGQTGPFSNGTTGTFQATDMAIEGNWNHIEGLHAVAVGTDEDGQPIMDIPVKYVIGDEGSTTTGPKKPLTVTFEPAGCGRVLYSTYHTTHSTHPGLAPQERVLVYLIMEIGVCNDSIVID